MFKDTPQGQTNYYLSKCCHAQVECKNMRASVIDTHLWYGDFCAKCKKQCTAIPASEL